MMHFRHSCGPVSKGRRWLRAAVLSLAAAAAAPGLAAAEGPELGGFVSSTDTLSRELAEIAGYDAPVPEELAPVETPDIAGPDIAVSDAPIISASSDPNAFFAAETPMPEFTGVPGLGGLVVVVELFTSQGCANCPPADAMLAALDDQPDVLPLSFHVDYWDYLGWSDSFARPQFTDRQQRYAYASGERALYTPQVIVDGQDTALSLRPAELMALVDAHRATPSVVSMVTDRLRDGRRSVELQPLSDLRGPVAVTLVHYVPSRTVRVAAGENAGRTITYRNVVIGMDPLAQWDGRQPLQVNFSEADHDRAEKLPEDSRHALLLQQLSGPRHMPGPIIGALRLD